MSGKYHWAMMKNCKKKEQLILGLEGKSGPMVTAGGLIFISWSRR